MTAMPATDNGDLAKLKEPDYLPARMINEFAYCKRLFHYEQVLGVFVHNEYTVEGKAQHKRVDKETRKSAPNPNEETEKPVVVSSIMLSSETYRVIAKLDLASIENGTATPIDYKRGAPYRGEDGLEAWKPDRVQLAIQAIVLRENGYTCNEGIIFYQKTRQRVRVRFDEDSIGEAVQTIEGAWKAASATKLPPPLVDSPKCPGCSLVSVCLPDETWKYQAEEHPQQVHQYKLFDLEPEPRKPPKGDPRLLVSPRADKRPLYLNTHGLKVGKSGDVLKVKDRKQKVIQEVRINDICQVNVMGNVQITTQATQALLRAEKPICYFSYGGWFYGIAEGLNVKNVVLRKAQVLTSDQDWFRIRIARSIVSGKIKNQRTMLMRNHIEPGRYLIRKMKRLAQQSENARTDEELLGFEGYAARLYFSSFRGMVKDRDGHDGKSDFDFEFRSRNRRPPLDPVNAMLSYGYSLLSKDLTVACYAVGFDPMLGYYHRLRHGRPALALDLMEPLRPLIVDSAVLSAVNTKMVARRHFVRAGKAVNMTPSGRKAFLRAYQSVAKVAEMVFRWQRCVMLVSWQWARVRSNRFRRR